MKPDYAESDESVPGAVKVGFTDPEVRVHRLILWSDQDELGEGSPRYWLSGEVLFGPEEPPVRVQIEIPPDSALFSIVSHDGPSMAVAAARMLIGHARDVVPSEAPSEVEFPGDA
jgi:hypothetical protein